MLRRHLILLLKVYRLRKALCDWYNKIDDYFNTKSKSESTLYTKTVKGSCIIIIVVYVDDFVCIKNGTKMI